LKSAKYFEKEKEEKRKIPNSENFLFWRKYLGELTYFEKSTK
jgi:hypothetical protein